jgi:hypothetical protein
MAFCPHCGKSVAEQAVKCLSCGGELEAKGKPARFKGTMIMQPAASPAAAAAPAPAPAPVAAPIAAPPAAASTPGMAVPTKPAPSKAKHTMIGTGGAGLGPAMLADFKKAQAAVAASAPPPPPAGALPGEPRLTDPALADTARNQGNDSAKPGPATPDDDGDDASSQRMLAGDPMAEKTAPKREFRPTPRPGDLPNVVQGSSSKPVIVIAVIGVLLIAIAGYVAARLMGLLG